MGSIDRHRNDSRGASEIIGYALLVGIVALSSLLIVVYGSSLINQAKSNVNEQSAELVVQELDSKLSTLSSLSDVQRIQFDLGETVPKDLRVVQEGFINITVNERPATCQAQVNLTSIRYETDNNRIVGYEAGGVWKGNPGAGTVMLTTPDVTFQNGSVNAAVTNVSGRIKEGKNNALLKSKFSDKVTDRLNRRLTTGACVRPDNVTVKVNNSMFYKAWGSYFKDEFGEARVFQDNQTVLTRIEQSELREVANDFENNVVNLSQSSPPVYMTKSAPGATIQADPGNSIPAHITVDKDADNTYVVQYQPLANATSIPISRRETVVQSLSQQGVGTDAVFVLDDSGSMGNDADNPDFDRLPKAKTAAARSLVVLNESDRVGLVGYDENASIHPTSGQLLTTARSSPYFDDYESLSDYPSGSSPYGVNEGATGFNGTLQELDAGGSTCIYCALSSAIQVMGAASNQSRNQTVILLTDGVNNEYTDQAILDLAETADSRNITVNTVRIGGGSGNSPVSGCSNLLKCIADRTGGQYEQNPTQSGLREFFKQALQTTETDEVVRRTALTTNASTSGSQIYDPYVAGDTDGMSMIKNGFMNVNDPMSPSTFEHSFAVDDGETVYLNASWYGCTDREDPPGPEGPEGPNEPEKNWTRTPVVDDGYPVYSCNDPNPDDPHNISDENVSVHLDGDIVGVGEDPANPGGDPDEWSEYNKSGNPSLNQSAPLLNDSARPWQQNMTTQLGGYLEKEKRDYNTSDAAKEYVWRLNLSSNQAIVVYNYSVKGEQYDDTNRLAMIYQIGLSEAAARPENIVGVRLSKVLISKSS